MIALFFLFVIIPLIEIYLFIEIGSEIGALATFGLIILTACAGAYFVNRQGLSLLMKAQQKVAADEMPADELFSGVCVLVAGLMLITPGFFTDSLGFLLLIPAVRTFLRDMILDGILGSFSFGILDMDMLREGAKRQQDPSYSKDDVIDAEFDVVDEDGEKLPPKR